MIFIRQWLVPLLMVAAVCGCMESALGPVAQDIACKDCNIIVLTIDALRADHVGAYGYRRNTTPNIDEFSKKGVIFKYAFVQWPRTSQSMASMLSGKYPSETGVRGLKTRVPADNLMLAEMLKGAGYRTGGFVTNPNLASFFGFDQGFDEYHEEWKKKNKDQKWTDIQNWYSASSVTPDVVDWVRKNKDTKFFLWVHYIDPHAPFTPPKPYRSRFVWDRYYQGDKLVPTNRLELYNRLNKSKMTEVDYMVSQYDGEIAYADDNVGVLLRELNEQGLLEKSIIIITADHGESMDEHGEYFKHGYKLYNPTLRIPLIIFNPRVKGGVFEEPVSALDIVPTVLDSIGAGNSGIGFEGQSLLQLRSEGGHTPQVFSEVDGAYSVVDGVYKLVLPKKSKRPLLFKYTEDPGESNPVNDSILIERLTNEIEEHVRNHPVRKNNAPQESLSPDIEEQLRTLGYIN